MGKLGIHQNRYCLSAANPYGYCQLTAELLPGNKRPEMPRKTSLHGELKQCYVTKNCDHSTKDNFCVRKLVCVNVGLRGSIIISITPSFHNTRFSGMPILIEIFTLKVIYC